LPRFSLFAATRHYAAGAAKSRGLFEEALSFPGQVRWHRQTGVPMSCLDHHSLPPEESSEDIAVLHYRGLHRVI